MPSMRDLTNIFDTKMYTNKTCNLVVFFFINLSVYTENIFVQLVPIIFNKEYYTKLGVNAIFLH